jgi:UDP-N-acetylmuramoyl-L-alanyl-D-glutamate--2,6-diaminopimelate ligase
MDEPRQVLLSDLVHAITPVHPVQAPETWIGGVQLDSRQVNPGDLFVAVPGGSTDGHRFIPDAIRRGAAAVVGVQALGDLPVPYFQVEEARSALAALSAAFYGFPGRKLTVIGVTGTDGKTTTSTLIFEILKAAGLQAGMISTLSAQIGDLNLDTGFHVTTPEAPEVQRFLAAMVASGLTHGVLEATSHGLEQQRVAGAEFDLGVVTNITHEHLDYHGSYENYRAAKARLFVSLAETAPKPQGNPRLAVLNRDDRSFDYLSPKVRLLTPAVRQVTYGFHPEARVRAESIEHHPGGLRFTAVGDGFRMDISSRLVGAFNVSNCLAAIAATVEGLGLDPEAAREGIAALPGIPGRMEVIDLGQDFMAVVDFAHTPNALRRALETARRLVSGRIIAVFGSAGLRDREKRRLMAEISADLADLTMLTAEDPRTESLEGILGEMAEGARARGGIEGQTFWRVPDRGQALRFAVSLARPGDIVIACGKGHEQSMCFGEIEYPWDDRQALQAVLAEHLSLPGPQVPYLPTQDRSDSIS